MFPNSIKKTIHKVSEQLFDVWWGWYYKFFNHPPKRYYTSEKGYDKYMLENWDKNPNDPVCFPLPFRINCIGCRGCKSVPNPPLRQYVHKGPYKVFFHPVLLEQYDGMFGKQATFDLVNDMRLKHQEIDLIHLREKKEETVK